MKSGIDRLRDEERAALALALGERDVELFRLAHRLSRAEAARTLERQNQHGRRGSACLAALIG